MNPLKRFIIGHPVWTVVLLFVACSLTIGLAGLTLAWIVWIGLSIWAIVWRHSNVKALPTHARPVLPAAPPPQQVDVDGGRPEYYAGPAPTQTVGRNAQFFVVGTGYHTGLSHLAPGRQPVIISREPGNPFDSNALRVWAGPHAEMVGFISARNAAKVAPFFDRAGIAAIQAEGDFSVGELHVFMPGYQDPLWRAGTASSPTETTADINVWPTVIEPWGQCPSWGDECDSETSVRAALEELQAAGAPATDEAHSITVQALLCLSVTNPAVAAVVTAESHRVIGYLKNPEWLGTIKALDAGHQTLTVPASIWAVASEGFVPHVVVRACLPDRSLVFPPGPLPVGANVILPTGSTVQVSGEEHHLNEVTALLDGAQERPVVATLHSFIKRSARSEKKLVEVRVYDEIVGELTPTMSNHMLPIVEACEEEGTVPVCRATVHGNQLKADVTLYVAKGGDIDQGWINDNIYGKTTEELVPRIPATRAAPEWEE